MEQNHRVRDERPKVITGGAILGMDLFKRKGFGAESFQNLVVFFDFGLQQRGEALSVDEIDDAKSGSSGFVSVGRTNAALGSSDLVFAFELFTLRIQLAVIRENDMRGFTEKEVAIDLDTELTQSFDFSDQTNG